MIREFLKENVQSYIEFNLYENDLAKQAFETINNSRELLIKVSALSTKPLIKGETIIFIDEVQAASDVVTKVKFLIEEGSYRYILVDHCLELVIKILILYQLVIWIF